MDFSTQPQRGETKAIIVICDIITNYYDTNYITNNIS